MIKLEKTQTEPKETKTKKTLTKRNQTKSNQTNKQKQILNFTRIRNRMTLQTFNAHRTPHKT